MIFMTLNANRIKRIGIIFFAIVLLGLLFCLWAAGAADRSVSEPDGQAVSDAQTANTELFTVLSVSETAQIPSAGDSGMSAEQPAVPAYVNLSPYAVSFSPALPLESAFISSTFGFRDHPINGSYSFHSGIDLAASEGSPIYAVLDGTVSAAKYDSGYGNYVILDHADGMQTLYAHCSSLCVESGDRVARGEQIALVGATGSATGPHLHLELRYGGQRYDPSGLIGDSYS